MDPLKEANRSRARGGGAESAENGVIRWVRSGGWSEVSRGPLGERRATCGAVEGGRWKSACVFEKKVESLFLATPPSFVWSRSVRPWNVLWVEKWVTVNGEETLKGTALTFCKSYSGSGASVRACFFERIKALRKENSKNERNLVRGKPTFVLLLNNIHTCIWDVCFWPILILGSRYLPYTNTRFNFSLFLYFSCVQWASADCLAKALSRFQIILFLPCENVKPAKLPLRNLALVNYAHKKNLFNEGKNLQVV